MLTKRPALPDNVVSAFHFVSLPLVSFYRWYISEWRSIGLGELLATMLVR